MQYRFWGLGLLMVAAVACVSQFAQTEIGLGDGHVKDARFPNSGTHLVDSRVTGTPSEGKDTPSPPIAFDDAAKRMYAGSVTKTTVVDPAVLFGLNR